MQAPVIFCAGRIQLDGHATLLLFCDDETLCASAPDASWPQFVVAGRFARRIVDGRPSFRCLRSLMKSLCAISLRPQCVRLPRTIIRHTQEQCEASVNYKIRNKTRYKLRSYRLFDTTIFHPKRAPNVSSERVHPDR